MLNFEGFFAYMAYDAVDEGMSSSYLIEVDVLDGLKLSICLEIGSPSVYDLKPIDLYGLSNFGGNMEDYVEPSGLCLLTNDITSLPSQTVNLIVRPNWTGMRKVFLWSDCAMASLSIECFSHGRSFIILRQGVAKSMM